MAHSQARQGRHLLALATAADKTKQFLALKAALQFLTHKSKVRLAGMLDMENFIQADCHRQGGAQPRMPDGLFENASVFKWLPPGEDSGDVLFFSGLERGCAINMDRMTLLPTSAQPRMG